MKKSSKNNSKFEKLSDKAFSPKEMKNVNGGAFGETKTYIAKYGDVYLNSFGTYLVNDGHNVWSASNEIPKNCYNTPSLF